MGFGLGVVGHGFRVRLADRGRFVVFSFNPERTAV